MSTKICIYAICKDEDKYLEQWFRNVLPADYIAILDTGSKPEFYTQLLALRDRTNAAAGYDKVIVKQKAINPWRFDVARNESMKLIPADANLCLCTDFDEVLCDGWATIIKSKWAGEPRVMYQYAWTHTATGLPAKIFTYDKCHANDGKHFWKYPVHECISIGTIEDDLAEIKQGLYITEPVPFLEHYPDPEKKRQQSYRELLELRAEEFPDESFSYTYLLAQLFWERKFEEVVEYGLNKAVPHCFPKKYNDQATMPDIYMYIGDAYRALNEPEKALEFHRMAIAVLPQARDGYLGCGWDLLMLHQPEEAIDIVTRGLIKAPVQLHIWSEREFSWTYEPHLIKMVAYAMLNCMHISGQYRMLAEQLGAPQAMCERLLTNIKSA